MQILPKSILKSPDYLLWPRMQNYLRDGKLKIDNNLFVVGIMHSIEYQSRRIVGR